MASTSEKITTDVSAQEKIATAVLKTWPKPKPKPKPITFAEAKEKSKEALNSAQMCYQEFLDQLVIQINEAITKNLIYKHFEFTYDNYNNDICSHYIPKPYTISDVLCDLERLYPNYIIKPNVVSQQLQTFIMSWE